MKHLIFPFIILFLLISCEKKAEKTLSKSQKSTDLDTLLKVAVQPAEFEEQEAVWLFWSAFDHLQGYSNQKVQQEIADTLCRYLTVKIACKDSVLLKDALQKVNKEAVKSGKIQIFVLPYEEIWARDTGALFVKMTNGKKAVADFGFNSWGYSKNNDTYNQIGEAIDRKSAEKEQLSIFSTKIISEGGDRESDGKGTLIVTEAVELGRNPDKTKAQIEAEFARVLGVKKTIWLKQGLREDDHTFLSPILLEDKTPAYTVLTTNGHTDEFARFVNDTTVLLAKVSEDEKGEIAAENRRRMAQNEQILRNSTTAQGKKLTIKYMPLPSLILGTMQPKDAVYDIISKMDYSNGHQFPKGKKIQVIAAASYLNFLIAGKVVIVPKYANSPTDKKRIAEDAEALRIFKELFPNRNIVQINPLPLNFGGGGIHCITMNEPK